MPFDVAVLLAGFVLAHAAWSVSDLPKGELLVPLAVIEKSGQRQLLRFQAATQEQAIDDGKVTIAQRQAELDAWAFGREGQMPEGSGKIDVLSVDAWAKGMARPITFVQRFRQGPPGGFRLVGDPIVVVNGRAVEGAEVTRAVKTLHDGVRQHPKAGPLWQEWHAK